MVIISGAAVPVKEQMLYETVQDLKRAHVPEASIQEVLELFKLLEGHLLGEIPWEEYEATLKAKRVGVKALLFKDFPSTPDDWQLGFFQRVGPFDPMPYWRRLDIPILFVNGERDDKAPTRASVTRLNEALAGKDPARWTITVFSESGHGLGDPKMNGLRKDFLDLLSNWIHEHCLTSRR